MRTIIIFLLSGLLVPVYSSELPKSIERHCQDLNVLYQKLNTITMNLANAKTTRTPSGGHYRRKEATECKSGFCKIKEADDKPIVRYQPDHPDANVKGFVSYPGFNVLKEQIKLQKWTRVYDAVVSSNIVAADFFLNDPRAKKCMDKYPSLAANHNFREYLGR